MTETEPTPGQSLADLISFMGRTVVVTGAARGVGAAIVRRFHEAGASVVIADLDGPAATELAAELGDRVVAAQVDVTDATSVDALVDFAATEFGGLHVWVNNAGIYPRAAPLDMTLEQWQQVMDVNLTGCFLGAQRSARRMVQNGSGGSDSGGVIVNVASASAFRAPSADLSHYVASKAGVVGLTRSLGVELGPSGVRVLAVAPILVSTGTALDGLRATGVKDPLAAAAARIPLRRVPVPDDIARVVLFAASGLASMMTGSTLLVDGGQLAG